MKKWNTLGALVILLKADGTAIISLNTYKENSTKLAKYTWSLKNDYIKFNIKWNTINHFGEVRKIHSICSTCSLEKLEIARASKRNNLNKRHKLFANCHI